jgi:hypothetical protein
MARCD